MKAKILIIISVVCFLQSCIKSSHSENLSSEKIQKIKESEEFNSLSESEKNLVSMDLQSLETKEKVSKEKAVDAWYNTKCRRDGRVCCSRCTANGDPNRCAKTRFSNCSVCGHSRGSHYAQRR
ncbi:hypothetical protein ACOSP6_06290 [Tenacibaculum sp. MEBiC06402]|uniref:hypothetical protein n=1 Tax=unclassified Tenacibaculum TaxID=2635139 RepID=UPI003B9B5D5A